MVREQSLFKYKTVKCPLHKFPAILKLLMMIFLSILCMSFSFFWLCAAILTIIFLSFLCGFTFKEQLTDLRPALYYSLIMYLLSVFSNLTEIYPVIYLHHGIFIPNPDYLRTACRLAFVVQISALLFRTTSFIEIKECLNAIELLIKRIFRIQTKTFASDTISLFIMFIPEFFIVWSNVNLAWKSRGGRQGIKKIKTLTIILITVSFEKAALRAKALASRTNTEEK